MLGRWGRITAAVVSLAMLAGTATATAAEPRERDTAMGSQIALREGTVDVRGLAAPTDGVQGIDVSGHQGNVDWAAYWAQGKRFAYVKATEGVDFINPYYGQQYGGSADVGMKRGAYHFALPNDSTGAVQAKYFVDNGGGWTSDGKTLPGAVDLEWNPYAGGDCYGKTKAQLVTWIDEFVDAYRTHTGRLPVIYTSTSWWTQCVGSTAFASAPLWIARYNSEPGTLPSGWTQWKFWQYDKTPVDQDKWAGTSADLQQFADDGRIPTAFATTLSPTTVVYGSTAKFSGKLYRKDSGAGSPSKTVQLQRRKVGHTTWSTQSTTSTGTGGSFAFTVKPSATTDYRAVYAGNSVLIGATSSTRRLAVRTAVTGSFSDSSVKAGTTTYFRGTVKPSHPGQSIHLQLYSGGKWSTVSTTTLTSTSTYSFAVRRGAAGTYTYRTYKPGDADHVGGYSPTRKLTVTW